MTRTYRKSVLKDVFSCPTIDVFTAAVVAQRINGGYFKNDNGDQRANRHIVNWILSDKWEETYEILDSDRELAKRIIQHFRGYSFKILSGTEMSDYAKAALTCATNETVTDNNYMLGVIVSLPNSYQREFNRMQADDILRELEGFVGNVGDRVTTEITVLKCCVSLKWFTNFITGITSDNKGVFFSFSKNIKIDSKIKVTGTVKAYRDNLTQLNRVRMLEQ